MSIGRGIIDSSAKLIRDCFPEKKKNTSEDIRWAKTPLCTNSFSNK